MEPFDAASCLWYGGKVPSECSTNHTALQGTNWKSHSYEFQGTSVFCGHLDRHAGNGEANCQWCNHVHTKTWTSALTVLHIMQGTSMLGLSLEPSFFLQDSPKPQSPIIPRTWRWTFWYSISTKFVIKMLDLWTVTRCTTAMDILILNSDLVKMLGLWTLSLPQNWGTNSQWYVNTLISCWSAYYAFPRLRDTLNVQPWSWPHDLSMGQRASSIAVISKGVISDYELSQNWGTIYNSGWLHLICIWPHDMQSYISISLRIRIKAPQF